MKISEQELKTLKQIHDLFLVIESTSEDANFPIEKLDQLKALLFSLSFSENQSLKKLSEIPDHLSNEMSLKHFVNFLVPIERVLNKNLQDDQFLVTTQDQPHKAIERRPIYFVLDNIRSAFNVGAIFRLADTVGASEVILGGYTPSPIENIAIQKTSLGSSQYVNFKQVQNIEDEIKSLRQTGVFIIALETSKKALSIHEPMRGPTAFIVGNERFGLDEKILSLVDEIRFIPTFGIKNSLNVGHSLSIAAYEWSRQN